MIFNVFVAGSVAKENIEDNISSPPQKDVKNVMHKVNKLPQFQDHIESATKKQLGEKGKQLGMVQENRI